MNEGNDGVEGIMGSLLDNHYNTRGVSNRVVSRLLMIMNPSHDLLWRKTRDLVR